MSDMKTREGYKIKKKILDYICYYKHSILVIFNELIVRKSSYTQ